MADVNVWRRAAEQMFFSLSVSWGGLITFGSYNKFKNPVHVHALAISLLDFITSIIASVVVFSILGELKVKLGLDSIEVGGIEFAPKTCNNSFAIIIQDVVKSGQGLAFIAYPEAVSLLPLPQLWAVLFFFMLFTLGLDSEFALLETVLTGVYDMFPAMRKHKAKATLVACIACFLIRCAMRRCTLAYKPIRNCRNPTAFPASPSPANTSWTSWTPTAAAWASSGWPSSRPPP